MNYEAVIFDFDYTLGDSTLGIFESINYALTNMGYKSADLESAKRTIGLSLKDTFTELTKVDDIGQAEVFHKFFREKSDMVMIKSTELLPYAVETLQRLKQNGCKTGIVTTKYHYRIEQSLDKFHISSLIDVIVGGNDVKIEKPDPEGLLKAIAYLKVDKNRVLYVGDSIVDAKTAQNAEVSFAAVTTGTTTREDFQKYDCVKIMNNLSELF